MFYDGYAGSLIGIIPLLTLQGFNGPDIGYASPGNDAFFYGCPGGVQGVFDPVFFLLHLHFGSGAHIENGDAAAELGKTFLQFLFIIVGGAGRDLCLDLVYTGRNVFLFTLAAHDSGIVFVNADGIGGPQVTEVCILQLISLFLADDGASRQDGNVLQHFLSPVSKSGGFHRPHLKPAPQLVNDQGSKGVAVQVFSVNKQVPATLCRLFQQGQFVFDLVYLVFSYLNVM